eukprot:TRINITY_DN9396_c0_g1_i2.p1 TRINITY_DN9396_c0_g1~~TRINITY_DN9396_c0_g1_i2.p1  ORF type:complete len:349 (+),score=40.22 TRINITY_DN9396_c0_g1_i2:236-1282(+)
MDSPSRSTEEPPSAGLSPVPFNLSAALGNRCVWYGKTMQEWTEPECPPTGEGPYWQRGDGKGLPVRHGPNYPERRHKLESGNVMYSAISCDAIKGDSRIEDIMGRLVHLEDLPAASGPAVRECDHGAGLHVAWTPHCKLPRILCINLMLPYETGLNPFRKDAGASFVAFFRIKPETVQEAMKSSPSPAVSQFLDFCQRPTGLPGGSRDNPDRSLASRLDPSKRNDVQSGCFKANAKCVNLEDVNVPTSLYDYNGKPCLITKSGYIIKAPNNEWLEIGIDVRFFNILVRMMLSSYCELVPQTKVHFGFLVQGTEDHELPEALLCDLYIYGVNIMDHPWQIDNDDNDGIA